MDEHTRMGNAAIESAMLALRSDATSALKFCVPLDDVAFGRALGAITTAQCWMGATERIAEAARETAHALRTQCLANARMKACTPA